MLRSIETPNDVVVTHTFDSPETARAFFAMPELKEAMREGGVDADAVQVLLQRGRTRRAGRRLVGAISWAALLPSVVRLIAERLTLKIR